MDYNNKTVVVTGGLKGMGAACANAFYKQGANVCVLDVSDAQNAVNDEKWFYQRCDVSKEDEVRKCMNEAALKFGSIDFLVNNAGIQRYGSVTETSLDDWNLVLNVNLTSMFLCAKYALPYMQQKNKGVIINIASVQAFVSQQVVAAYTTSKTAILGLTRSIAVDYSPYIRCVAVCPGTVDTPMLRDSIALSPNPDEVMQECVDMHLTKRIGTPEEIASLVLYLCSDAAAFITGTAIRIDGGLGITVAGSKRD